MSADLLTQLGAWIQVSENGCWEWQLGKDIHGYGKAKRSGKTIGAHRLVWVMARGPIAEGLQIDHLCRNRPCVNPDHLEPVTASENIRRGKAAQGAYDDCPKHGPKEFNARGLIVCRGCKAERARTRNAQLRGTEPPRHGLRSSYGKYKCRCAECVAAQYAYVAATRAVLREPKETP